MDVHRDAFELAEPLQAVGAALGADPLQFILGGGDDHALLATFPEGSVPDGWLVVGTQGEARVVGGRPADRLAGAGWGWPGGWGAAFGREW